MVKNYMRFWKKEGGLIIMSEKYYIYKIIETHYVKTTIGNKEDVLRFLHIDEVDKIEMKELRNCIKELSGGKITDYSYKLNIKVNEVMSK